MDRLRVAAGTETSRRVASTAAETEVTRAHGMPGPARYRYRSLELTRPWRPTTTSAQSRPYVVVPEDTASPVAVVLSPSRYTIALSTPSRVRGAIGPMYRLTFRPA